MSVISSLSCESGYVSRKGTNISDNSFGAVEEQYDENEVTT